MADANAKITVSAEDLASAIIEKVRQSQQGLKEDVEKTGPSLDDFKGKLQEAFEHPLGAVKSMASSIGEELVGSLSAGEMALGGFVAAGAGVAALGLEMSKAWAEQGESIYDLSLKTSSSVESVSRMKGALDVAGGSIDQFANLMFRMNGTLDQGGPAAKKIQDGLELIGLSMADIKGKAFDEQIIAISNAMRENRGHVDEATVALDLFSRQGRDALPVLMKDIDDLTQSSHDLGSEWSTTDAEAAAHFAEETRALDERWQSFKRTLEGEFLPVGEVTIGLLGRIGTALEATWSGVTFEGVRNLYTSNESLNASLENATKIAGDHMAAVHASAGAVAGLSMTWKEAEAIGKTLDDSTKNHIEVTNKDTEAIVKQGKAATENATRYSELIDKLNADMTKERVALVDKAAKNEQAIAFAKDKEILSSFMDLNRSLTGLDAERVRQLLAMNGPGGVVSTVLAAQGKEVSHTLSESFTAGFAGIGPSLLAAIQGGGKAIPAVASSFGLGFSQHMFGSADFQNTITSHFSGAMGKMFNAILPGIGSLAGPLIGGIAHLFEGLFGKTEWQKNFEALTKSVNDQRQALIDEYGSLDALRGMAGDTGDALYNAFQEQGAQGIHDASDALKNFNAVMAQAKQAANEYGLTWKNLDDAHMPDQIATQLKNLKTKEDELITTGYSYNDVIKAQAKQWDDVVIAAMKSGTAINESYYPVLKDLADMGLLLDAAGNKLQVLDTDGVISFQAIASGAAAAGAAGAAAMSEIGAAASAAASEAARIFQFNTGYNPNGGAGNGTSPGKDTSDILKGYSPGDAEKAWLDNIASKGSDDSDWKRVKDQYGFVSGGIVPGSPIYAAAGFPGSPRGTDTVPIWATPGEGVLSRKGMAAFDRMNRGEVPDGGAFAALHRAVSDLSEKVDRHLTTQSQALDRMPIMLRHAMRGVR